MAEFTEVVIVINPGSTSTKFALWKRTGGIKEITVRHQAELLAPRAVEQFEYRRQLIDAEIEPAIEGLKVVGVVGRGGLLKPLKGGTYLVNDSMLNYLKSPECGNHASNLGALLADYFAHKYNVSAYIVDPVVVDEFIDVARISGIKWIERKSRSHALNIKAVVRRAAKEIGKPVDQTRFVVAHLGGGSSIVAVDGGRLIDANDALLGMGPYSPERAGALPIGPLVEKCFSGTITKQELLAELSRKGGLTSYCGTSDLREVLNRVHHGDPVAEMALRGMIYQDVKEIGAMGAVLSGKLDGIILTGGQVHNDEIVDMIRSHIAFLGRVIVYPGEGELEALAEGAFLVIDGNEQAQEYRF